MKELAAIVGKLVQSVPALMIVLGAILIVLGLAKGIQYQNWLPLDESPMRITAIAIGILVLGLGAWFSKTRANEIVDPKSYGIAITLPKPGNSPGRVDVHGTFKKKPPEGYVLRVLRVYPNEEHIPLGHAKFDERKGTWEVLNCDIGGEPGDPRDLVAALVGPSGSALFEYFDHAAALHNTTLRQYSCSEKRRYVSPSN